MSQFELAVLAGDGIGPEVTQVAVRVLHAVGDRFGHTFMCHEAPVGQAAIDREGVALSSATIELCTRSDAVLFGAVGGATAQLSGGAKPEDAILGLRKALDLFANLRPVTT